jgi:hypothetical protein
MEWKYLLWKLKRVDRWELAGTLLGLALNIFCSTSVMILTAKLWGVL